MVEIGLRIVCDHASAPSFGVTLGSGWARITVTTPPVADWAGYLAPLFSAVRMMLAPFALPGLERARLIVDGPDAHGLYSPEAHVTILHTWLVAIGAAPPSAASAPPDGSSTNSVAGAPPRSAPAPAAAAPVQSPPTIVVPPGAGPRAAAPAPDRRTELVLELARVVRTHAAAHGAAPNFHSRLHTDHQKARNYIQSVTQTAATDSGLLEEVRAKLAAT